MSTDDLLDTDEGMALANAAWQEGATAMERALRAHEAEGGPYAKPRSPYSAPLLARIKARKEER